MTVRKGIYYFVIFISTIVVLASLLSLFYNLPYWYSKLLDFPRLQYFVLGIACLIGLTLLTRKWNWPTLALVLGLASAMTIHALNIFPYWFGEKSVPDAVQVSEENSVGILLANVLISNRESHKFLDLVIKTNPDILLVMEVDQWWLDELESLKEDYPFVVEQPNEVAYGMALYSKLPILDNQIKYIKHKNVPSFHSRIALPSGKEFMLHSVHPVAPVPSEKYPDNVGEAENELVKVGDYVAQQQLPAIVAGDYNDVSWSHTARMFGDSGKLNNVRIGRGLFNSFDANSLILRWPLDHYYLTKEFKHISLQVLEKIGSDHFPMYAKFLLED
jgi:endonuclease/exonuclease/phosphatase (EEP) superfamily protein YafD